MLLAVPTGFVNINPKGMNAAVHVLAGYTSTKAERMNVMHLWATLPAQNFSNNGSSVVVHVPAADVRTIRVILADEYNAA